MENSLQIELIKHLKSMMEVKNLSKKILAFAKKEDFKEVVKEADNRERLLKILTFFQRKIESQLENMNVYSLSQETLEQIKSWHLEYNKILEDISCLDKELIDILEKSRNETSKEIALIFKSKEKFKGYNLNSVKR